MTASSCPGQTVKLTRHPGATAARGRRRSSAALDGASRRARVSPCRSEPSHPAAIVEVRGADDDAGRCAGHASPTGSRRAKPAATCSMPDAPFGLPLPADAVPARASTLEIGGATCRRETAARVPLRGQHLQRREAHGAAGRPGDHASRVTPDIAIVPAPVGPGPAADERDESPHAEPSSRTGTVTVTNNAPGAAETDVHLDVPGWLDRDACVDACPLRATVTKPRRSRSR